ncbi:MAG: hypothetical protein ACOYX1_09745 [Acidobacteriota bacterium]
MSSEPSPSSPGRPLTEKQLAARRSNARKSTGPKSPQGKARSSKNALKHGLFAQTALLDFEPSEEFVALRDSYLAEHQPQGPTEAHFVMEMANAQWRLRRVRGMEADLIQRLIATELDPWLLTPGQRQAEAVRRLADDSHVLLLLQRYEVMFRRQYERALHLLWEHRDRRRLSQPAPPLPRPAPSLDCQRQPPPVLAPQSAPPALPAAPSRDENTKLQNEPKPPSSASAGKTSPPPQHAGTAPGRPAAHESPSPQRLPSDPPCGS